SSSVSDSSTCVAINNRGRIAPTTAMIGNECCRTKVGTLIDSRLIGVEDDIQSRSSERVASHKRTPRHKASPTPIAESVASAPSFQLTNSLVACGSYLRYDGIMKAAMATIAITGGPMRITK